MRKATIFIVVVAMFVAGLTTLATAQTKFGELLWELEVSVKWSSQSSDWRGRRAAWREEVASAANVAEMKVLLKEFERNIKWSAQYPSWKNKRSGWMGRVDAASTQGELARTLIALEKSIKYEAQASNWRSKRPGWLARVRELQ